MSSPSCDFFPRCSNHTQTCMCLCDHHANSVALDTCSHLSGNGFLSVQGTISYLIGPLLKDTWMVPSIFCNLQTMLQRLCLYTCPLTYGAIDLPPAQHSITGRYIIDVANSLWKIIYVILCNSVVTSILLHKSICIIFYKEIAGTKCI